MRVCLLLKILSKIWIVHGMSSVAGCDKQATVVGLLLITLGNDGGRDSGVNSRLFKPAFHDADTIYQIYLIFVINTLDFPANRVHKLAIRSNIIQYNNFGAKPPEMYSSMRSREASS